MNEDHPIKYTRPQRLVDFEEMRDTINEQSRRIANLEEALELMLRKFDGVADTDSERAACNKASRILRGEQS